MVVKDLRNILNRNTMKKSIEEELTDLLMEAESYSKQSKKYQQIKEKIKTIYDELKKRR